MNIVEPYSIAGPYGDADDCAMFTINDIADPFIMSEVTNVDQTYALSFWLKGDGGTLTVGGKTFTSTETWSHCTVLFLAESSDLEWVFGTTGVYYIYHTQLELGNVATDWVPNPDDVDEAVSNAQQTANGAQQTATDASNRILEAESRIEQLANAIKMVVTGENGESAMTQTENGWTFDISSIIGSLNNASGSIDNLTESLGGVESTVSGLQTELDALGVLTDYVIITSYNGQPCIELGESDNQFRLRITNTEIQFVDGSNIPAYIANQNGVSKLMIDKADVTGELQIGDFVWQKRPNGNVGLMWIGGSA